MKISDPSVTHAQLLGLTGANHHEPLKVLIFDLGADAWFIPGWSKNGMTPFAYTQHSIVYIPIYVDHETTFTRIGARVTTGGGVGTVMRLGIYNAILDANNQLKPDSLLVDAGTFDANSVATHEIVISETLAAGWYFLVSSTDGTPAMAGIPLTGQLAAPVVGASSSVQGGANHLLNVIVADGAVAFNNPAITPTANSDIRKGVVNLRL